MKLAIADPPYPPQFGERRDRPDGPIRVYSRSRALRYYHDDGVRSRGERQADHHPDAGEWDDPARHRQLLEDLCAQYSGWAIATMMDGLDHYRPLPIPARVMVWHKTTAHPSPHRIANTLEAVILYPPEGRRHKPPGALQVPDIIRAPALQTGFPGAKPAVWTRWVLDALGYDPDQDELHDLFPGSGAVTAAASQGVLL